MDCAYFRLLHNGIFTASSDLLLTVLEWDYISTLFMILPGVDLLATLTDWLTGALLICLAFGS